MDTQPPAYMTARNGIRTASGAALAFASSRSISSPGAGLANR